jgi:hypothetical protein
LAPQDAVPAFREADRLAANAQHEQAMDGCSCDSFSGESPGIEAA